MGLKYRTYLDGTAIYGCTKCRTHLTTGDAIVSRQFQGQHGQAYLFNYVVNILQGEAEDRSMTTGLHTVRDISCVKCSTVLGWTYVKAYNDDNKYKEGKFILEKKLLTDVK
ncbi:Yippee/Mis18 [Zychaea mexicana]|uniref:Yippee/Mis18 n=1 Tax=Zychaea mexicana TaxID=64656 RepID=UPI0022FE8897|nr:Yippee/Mis18 [Zychaea mexicana]KAI9488846.1 Yippee/Mis18 [Zychaea mexicana]